MLKERQAEKLAEFIHCGKKRRNGENAVEHSRRVAIAIKELGHEEDMICASWLHDTEDFELLREMFSIIENVFGYKVYGLVLLLSHVPKSTHYNDYICNIVDTSQDAMVIKWQDMIDNTRDDIPRRQWKKYRDACLFLQSKNVEIPEVLVKRLRMSNV